MSLEAKALAELLLGEESGSTLLVEGDNIIAHVHSPVHVQLFAHAEEMYELLRNFSMRKCDKVNGKHSPACRACAATALLHDMTESDGGVGLH